MYICREKYIKLCQVSDNYWHLHLLQCSANSLTIAADAPFTQLEYDQRPVAHKLGSCTSATQRSL